MRSLWQTLDSATTRAVVVVAASVLLLAGAARLEVDGQPVEMSERDWLMIPAGTPHRVLGTEPGTEWLAVHGASAGTES